MLEYVLVLAGLLVVCTIMWGLVGAAAKSADRSENLTASDYP